MISILQKLFSIFFFLLFSTLLNGKEFPFPGDKAEGLNIHALIGADIQVNPQTRIINGVVLIRAGLIEKVIQREGFKVPPGYRKWDMSEKTIYPGLIDPYLLIGNNEAKLLDLKHDQHIHATADLSFHGIPSTRTDPGSEGPGFEISGVHPEKKVVDSFQADGKKWDSLRKYGYTIAHIVPSTGIFRGTGPCVLLSNDNPNQSILKKEVAQILAFDPVGKKETPSVYPASLMGVLAVIRQTLLDTQHAQRLLVFQQENPKNPPFSPHSGLTSLFPLLRKKEPLPLWIESGSCLMTKKAIELGREFNLFPILIATGDEWRRPDLACSQSHSYITPLRFPALSKLPEEDDWDQISLDQLRAWDHAPSNPVLLSKKTKALSFTTTGNKPQEFHKNIRRVIQRGLTEQEALSALTINPAKLCGIDQYVGTIEKGKLANLFVLEGKNYFSEDISIHSTWIQGKPFIYQIKDSKKAEKKDNNSTKPEDDDLVATFPSSDRKPIEKPSSILFTNATIWTCSRQGILKDGELLVENGKIKSIGKEIKGVDRSKIRVVNAQGKHLTPGIIDCHSHAMILGGVNESTLPSTAMVRIGDVINSESINIERQLAGGVTSCNLLHGSANPIGGQNAVIKLRLGNSPSKLLMSKAPKGIKFALGENVKQANWGDKYTTRFPQSRMGVQSFFTNRFTAAREYGNLRKKSTQGASQPVRTILELETILEILNGERMIHCHSYRQDEILVFLRTMESFGVQVGTLQHVLEGYKIADEIAQHGAGASTFSDWWAYKFEVYDAIPYAGALMHDRGCVVSFNSDSPDHARRLNLEAAKAVKYGGLSEMEALQFITLNPAKQLGIDQWVGSIEVGKDADLALWSGNPLDYKSKCERTWIDGTLFHEIKASKKRDQKRAKEREKLILKAKNILVAGKSDKATDEEKALFFHHALETACDLYPHSCRSHGNHKQGGHQ